MREPKVTPKKKPTVKKPFPKEEKDLSTMGLFELSIEGLIPCEVHREIKGRLENVLSLLKHGMPSLAREVVEDLLKGPQASNFSKVKPKRGKA